ncbi:DNA internalization-related competence protein ComEC/Rec2 [Bacillus sp. 1P06AnD]|uniref:DNA internalization-related competence protein ComEC/Rec2 n=1 Tax=Bacillus sp. 1P06AnD TaxID=3132208 RepID=UPI0039A044F7
MILLLAAGAIMGTAAFLFKWLIAAVTASVFLLLCVSHHKKGIILFLSAFYFFLLMAFFHHYLQATRLSEGDAAILASFTDVPSIDGYSFKAAANVDGESVILQYTFRSLQEKEQMRRGYRLGMRCSLKGTFIRPEKSHNPNGFDYRFYLQTEGIHWIFKSEAFPLQSCSQPKQTMIDKVKEIRLRGLNHIEQSFSSESRGFVAALLFGESGWIDEETYSAYKRLSLVHILAISGLHVTLVSAALFYLGIRLGAARETVQIVLIVVMPIYAILAGGAPSVVRACLMVMLFLSLSIIRKRISSLTVLCTVFLLFAIIHPFSMYQAGFQLSFFITFSLLMSWKIIGYAQFKNKAVQSLLVTCICQLASLPIILYHFQNIALWGFIWNVLYIPLYTFFLLPLSFVSFLFSVVGFPFAGNIIALTDYSFHYSNSVALWMKDAPLIQLSFAKPGILCICLLLALFIYFFYAWEKRLYRLVRKVGIFILALHLLLYFSVYLSPYGEVTLIDVGQGDSILMKRPFGKGIYLVDAGGILSFSQEEWMKKRKAFDPGKEIVVPFLLSKGIRSLDAFILTHDDADHIGGALAVLENIQVKELIIPEALLQQFQTTAVWNVAVKRRIPIKAVKSGYGWRKGGDVFRIVHPSQYEGDSNETSIVLWAKIGGISWLMTGDLGMEGEAKLLRSYPQLKADVLKIGHHGSKTSTSPLLLDTLMPKIACVSVGKNNRYHHPHASVLNELDKRKIPLLRTDQQGAITYSFRYGQHKGTFSVMSP